MTTNQTNQPTMTRFNLETEFANAWDAEVAKLTPEDRAKLANSTPADWFAAIVEVITDLGFWGRLGAAFLEGMQSGFAERR